MKELNERIQKQMEEQDGFGLEINLQGINANKPKLVMEDVHLETQSDKKSEDDT